MLYFQTVKSSNISCRHTPTPWSKKNSESCPWFISHPPEHIATHSDAIYVYQELLRLLHPRWAPSFVAICWLCFCSSFVVDMVLSCILVPPSTTLAVVCAGVVSHHMSKPAKSSFSQNVVHVCCPVSAPTSTYILLYRYLYFTNFVLRNVVRIGLCSASSASFCVY